MSGKDRESDAAGVLYWEDFRVGERIEMGRHRFGADEIIAFARQFDPQPFHTDADAAAKSFFGGLVASGWHTCAVGMRLTVESHVSKSASLGSPGLDNIRWLKPVRAGDTITYSRVVLESRASQSRPGVGLVKSRWEAVNQHGETVMTMEGWGMFGRRPAGGRRRKRCGVKLELNHKIHVLTKREELDSVRTAGKVVIVLDVLFATTTMVTALAHGAREVIPVLDEAAARREFADFPQDACVLSGELMAETLPGFAHPAPLALVAHGVAGKSVIYSTTNGTVAMRQAAGAARVYCGALVNAGPLAQHVVREHAGDTILLVCSGSANNFNLEDFIGAGAFVSHFARLLGAAADFSDAAKAALSVYRAAALPEALLDCRVGRMMARRGLVHEVEFACREDAFAVVPVLEDGRLRGLSGSARSRRG